MNHCGVQAPVLVVLLLVASPPAAIADSLNELAGPRASKWGDSPEKVIKAEGREPGIGMQHCVAFKEIPFDKRLYDISYGCFEPGRSLSSSHPWRHGKKIATVAYTPTPFTDQGDPKEAFAWWETELSRKYGKPQLQLEEPFSQGQEAPEHWPHWCPSGLSNLMGWDNGDCPLPSRFTSYRRWKGKRTIIELFDRGAHMPVNPPEVVVVFTERAFFEAAEKAHMASVARRKKGSEAQAKSRKTVPGF